MHRRTALTSLLIFALALIHFSVVCANGRNHFTYQRVKNSIIKSISILDSANEPSMSLNGTTDIDVTFNTTKLQEYLVACRQTMFFN